MILLVIILNNISLSLLIKFASFYISTFISQNNNLYLLIIKNYFLISYY